jgi:predicted 3-demethylubiquinone-9 3-methyltransferase (glyoxalase superfamily)
VAALKRITPCLWFDDQAEEAVQFYTSIFAGSSIGLISRYGEAGKEIHGRPPGSVLTIAFELDGQPFTALNGGPAFRFNEAVSFQVMCETQEEVDYYWDKLREGGVGEAQWCGWLKDRFGLSWQIVPNVLPQMIGDPDSARSQRVFAAIMKMKKIVIADLKRAYDG